MGKVRIYGTIGPACRDREILKQMFQEGMDGVRLNLSHTLLEEASVLIESCHEAARECGIDPELLIDMQGPELRAGIIKTPLRLNPEELINIRDIPLPEKTIVFGEIGLTGEVRGVGKVKQRIAEAERLGYKLCIIPRVNVPAVPENAKIKVIDVANIKEAVEILIKRNQ